MLGDCVRSSSPCFRSLRIALIYTAFSVVWILFSDQALLFFVKDVETLTELQTIKGGCFVAFSALVIFLLLYKEIKGHISTKERFQAIFDHHFQLTGLLTTEGVLISANPAALKFINAQEQDVLGKYFWDTPWFNHSPESMEVIQTGVSQAAKGKFVRFETTHSGTDGKIHHIDFSINPVTNDNGKIIYLVPEGRDISSIKEIENALVESQTLYREAQAIAHIGHWKYDLIGKNLDWSGELFNIFEINRDAFDGSFDTFLSIVHPDDRDQLVRTFNEAIKGKKQFREEHRIVLPDGRVKHILEQGRTERDKDGVPVIFIGTAQDITEKKVAEEKLRQAQKLEAIGTLAGGIAHDFNNILAGVIGYTEIALADLPADSPARRSLEQVLVAAFRARDLVKQILTFSRQSASEKMSVDLGPIVEEVVNLMRASLPATIEIITKFNGGRFFVFGDSVHLHQVVTNLCTNGGQAMQSDGGVLAVELATLELDAAACKSMGNIEPGEYVALTVEDTGAGMDAQVMEKIFNPFFTTKLQEEGTGLGLSVVHGIVKEHGGEIVVKSKPGQGTSFVIYFPKVNVSTFPDRASDTPLPGGRESILLVDDEGPIVEIYGSVLRKLGYTVESTTNSQEAHRLFSAHPGRFDLVVSDQTMPKMTGSQLAKQLLKIRPDIPIILCTGFSHELSKDQTEHLGIRKLLVKPVSKRDLAASVRTILDQPKEQTGMTDLS